MQIVEVRDAVQFEAAKALIVEYSELPHIAGRWRDPAAEIAALPGEYVPPTGAMLLAMDGDTVLGVVCLRGIEPAGVCEMKRLYVSPAGRGRGVGEALSLAVMGHARSLGYTTMKLDTAPELAAARALYGKLGFHEIPRYLDYQSPDAVCYERSLTD